MTSALAPVTFLGLRHVALRVRDIAATKRFYVDHFGMHVVWEPDPHNVYLSSGCDNLALHQERGAGDGGYAPGRLDHIGVLVASVDDVHRAAERFAAAGVPLAQPLRTHRDGSCSFYVRDPDDTLVQVLYEPTISALRLGAA